VIHVGVTRSPNDAWVAQQIRNANPFGEGPRFLLCDNDAKYGTLFSHAVNGANIEIIHTPLSSPQANAICERFIGSVRRECLDFVLILSERHAQRIIWAYIAFFNHTRPHQGIAQRIPEPSVTAPLPDNSPLQVASWPILGGLHHDYRRVA